MPLSSRPSFSALGLVASLLGAIAPAAQAGPEGLRFNRDIRPILAENCFACHGPDNAGRKGGLRLDVRDLAVGEAASGAHAVVPGNVKDSELVARIVTDEPEDIMPPERTGKTLTAREKALLQQWIAQGAPYEKHWSLVPPERIEPPAIAGAVHPVDRFVRERLQQEKVEPAPEAPRETLIRRLSLDLTGLPPTREEVEAFVADARTDAYERLVDRLLGSIHFGEKWARWWLDLAHYGDSDGIRLDNFRPYAWRYRQWVVEAFNRDLPFDQFTIEQLAGDLLPNPTIDQRIATGFLRNTISDRQTGNADPALGRVRQVVDRTSTTGTVWMGLTVGCAECHDHKFDPISQREFFRLYAFFNTAEEENVEAPLPGELERHLEPRRAYAARRQELLAPMAAELETLQRAWEDKIRWIEANPGGDHAWARAHEILVTSWGRGQGEGQFEGMNIVKTPWERRTPAQHERLQDYFLRNGRVIAPDRFKELKIAEAAKELDALARKVPRLGRAQAMAQAPYERKTWIHTRGDFRRPGEFVTPGTPEALPPLEVQGEPTRLDLARWLVSPGHPLTARVTVNRLWQELFGRGLVATSDNLGFRGEAPSHAALLDWLALEFPARGWSIKQMLRLMVTSATYRQSSHARPELAERDPANVLLARQTRLRLSAEGVRDATLAASGLLNPRVGGPSVRPPQPEGLVKENTRNPWVADQGDAVYRRGLYTFIHRLTPFAQLTTFDFPGTAQACAQRERSNTPLQALNLLNDPAFVEAAQAFARRLWREVPGEHARRRLEHAFLLALARPPAAAEIQALELHLNEQRRLYGRDEAAARTLAGEPIAGTSPAESAAWISLASVLLNLDEFINRE